ncbi:MAG: RNA polymerase sigma factor [Isosphaeraceae bacterium]
MPLDAAPDPGGGRGEEGGRLLDMLSLSQTSPSQAVSQREQLVLLADAVAGLADSEAEVLWLYYAEALSFEAIGQRLGLSRKSVRGIYARGLKHLKRTMEGPPGGPLRYDDGSASQ